MSIDKLQSGIRKLKNPSMVTFTLDRFEIPAGFLENAASIPAAYGMYAKALLEALRETVPAVRFSFASFAAQGIPGLEQLSALLSFAGQLGYYVLLDAPDSHTPQEAALLADSIIEYWHFDGLFLSWHLGSDGIKPFADAMKNNDKDLFVALRTGNKSAGELQDLLSGSRLVYLAAADMTKRFGETRMGKCGYSRVAGVGPATSADNLRTLRSKYPAMFLLIDGYDYSGANAKNCSLAFDQLGHGAVACAGSSVIAAWQEENACGRDEIALAVEAAERMKKNLTRYVTVL